MLETVTNPATLARQEAELSMCSKRKVGCVITGPQLYPKHSSLKTYKVLGKGHNFHPDGNSCEIISTVTLFDGSTTERVLTDPAVVHAEISALNEALATLQRLKPAEAYAMYPPIVWVTHEPCSNCKKALIAKGFTDIRVVSDKLETQNPSKENVKMTDIDAVLTERGSRYGTFEHHAQLSQGLKAVMQSHSNFEKLPADMKESLEMIMHKVARIINGDATYKDSWTDIIGYAKLVEETL